MKRAQRMNSIAIASRPMDGRGGLVIGVVLALALILLSATASAAGVYKWVDDKGKVHYGDRPPASASSKSVNVESRGSSTAGPVSEAERAARRQRLLQSFEADRAERANQRAQKQQALAKKRELKRKCAYARDNIEQLRSATGVYDLDHTGERRYLSNEERASYLKKYQAKVKKHCG